MSIAKNLGRTLGGKWTYDHVYAWYCDDGERTVVRTSAGVDEFDNEVGPPLYYLHFGVKANKAPERAEPYMTSVTRRGVALFEKEVEDAYRKHTA